MFCLFCLIISNPFWSEKKKQQKGHRGRANCSTFCESYTVYVQMLPETTTLARQAAHSCLRKVLAKVSKSVAPAPVTPPSWHTAPGPVNVQSADGP